MPVVRKSRTAEPANSGGNGSPSLPEKSGRGTVSKEIKVSLPSRNNSPGHSLEDYTICIYGEKGIGKSSLCAAFPDSLTFMWEFYRRNLPIRQVPDEGEEALDWPRFKSYVQLLRNLPRKSSDRPKSIITDSVDRAYIACQTWYCKRIGISHPNDANDYGKTWHACTEEFRSIMEDLKLAGYSLRYTSHAKFKEVHSRIGDVYETITPTCYNQAWEFLKEACDLAFYYGYRGQKRTLSVRGSQDFWSACGLPDHFLHPKSKEPVAEIFMGENPRTAYAALVSCFDNKNSEVLTISEVEKMREESTESQTAPPESEPEELPRKRK